MIYDRASYMTAAVLSRGICVDYVILDLNIPPLNAR